MNCDEALSTYNAACGTANVIPLRISCNLSVSGSRNRDGGAPEGYLSELTAG